MSDSARDIVGVYRRHAAAWASARSQDLFEKSWLDRFMAHLGPSRRVLDLGCGSGRPIAQYLAENACHITGVDSSRELLDMARAAIPGRWIEADMRNLELDDRFDGLLAWHSFFHLTPEDQRQMFPIFQKHVLPGAPLLFTTGTSYGSSVGTLEEDPLYHGSLDPWEYRELLDSHGFTLTSHVEHDPACQSATAWLARRNQPTS